MSQGILSAAEIAETNVRLRKFSTTRNSKGETFETRETMTLAELGLTEKEHLCLEIRGEADPVFVEYNPNEMVLSLYLWDETKTSLTEIEQMIQAELQTPAVVAESATTSEEGGGASTENNKWLEVLVPGREKSTVAQLFQTIREKFQLSEDQSFHVLPFPQNSNIPLHLIEDPASELRKKYQVAPASKLLVELVTAPESESKLLQLVKFLRG